MFFSEKYIKTSIQIFQETKMGREKTLKNNNSCYHLVFTWTDLLVSITYLWFYHCQQSPPLLLQLLQWEQLLHLWQHQQFLISKTYPSCSGLNWKLVTYVVVSIYVQIFEFVIDLDENAIIDISTTTWVCTDTVQNSFLCVRR